MKLHVCETVLLERMMCYRGWMAFKLVLRDHSQPTDKDMKVFVAKETTLIEKDQLGD